MIRTIPSLFAVLSLATLALAQAPPRPPVEGKPVVVVTTPVATTPAKQDPVKPATERPATGEPTAEKATAEKATAEKPTVAKPTAGKSTAEKPAAEKAPGDQPKDGEKPAKPEQDPPEDQPADQPLPPGASPDDIRAMRSAQEMISTERRLLKKVKSGEIKGVDKLLRFEEVAGWPYQDGLKACPEAVRKLDGKKVAMIGFMLPIDEVEHIKEFLLVQSLWACCYGTPPDINGIVRVVMSGDKRTDYQFDPVLVVGTFRVKESREDGYCIDIYQLEAESVSTVK